MKKYKKRDWLYERYWIEKLSVFEIAKSCKVCFQTIYYWMEKLDIPRRSRGEASHLAQVNHCILFQEAIEWINGELLGDACLTNNSPYSAKFNYGSKYLEYIQYISDTLKSFGVEQSGKINKYYQNNCYVYHYQSLSYSELTPIRMDWYPNGKKIVPRNIKLTSLTCRQWYIGDGCLIHKEKRKPRIILYTNGFNISDVGWLLEQLRKIGFKCTRQLKSNTIAISSCSTEKFLSYIGDCPVECYQYKWNFGN